MFKRKKKNTITEMTYDEAAYNRAYTEWTMIKPRLQGFELEQYFMSSQEERAGVYFSWARGVGSLYVAPISRQEEVQQFACSVSYNSVLMYTLERFLHSDELQVGCVLEPIPNYYYGGRPRIEYSVIFLRQEDDVVVEWYNHTKTPEQVIQQHYSFDDLAAIRDYLFACKEQMEAYFEQAEEWKVAMPQKWQFPPLREEEKNY